LTQRCWLTIAVVIAFAFPAARPRADRLPIKAYTTADGLANGDVRRIVRDSHGFLWFATADGLSQFDGYVFRTFGVEQGLPHSSVTDFVETRAGEFWVATGGGLARFDPRGAGHAMFVVVGGPVDDRRSKAITVVVEGSDGTIWAGTHDGLYRLDRTSRPQSLQPVPIQMPVDVPLMRIVGDVLEDRGGSLWLAAPGGLYRRWPDGTTQRYTTNDGLPHDYLHDLLQDHEGRLWVTTRYAGLFRLNYDQSHRPPRIDFDLTPAQGLTTGWVFRLFEDSDRRLWAATARGLVEVLRSPDLQGRRFHAYARSEGLTYHDVTAIAEDLGGNLWLGTNTSGAMRIARGGFIAYGERDGVSSIHAIFEDRAGHVCFRGTFVGDGSKGFPEFHNRFGCYDGERFESFMPSAIAAAPGWVGEGVSLQTRQGEWWLGTGAGVYRFAARNRLAQLKSATPLAVYTTKHGLSATQVFRLFEDRSGNVWISTTSQSGIGLARWDAQTGVIRDFSHDQTLAVLKDDLAGAFGEDLAGNLWIGFSGGIARFANGTFRVFGPRDGLPAGRIADIHSDRLGRIWLASTQSGLTRIDDSATERPTFVKYTTAQGLASNTTNVITEDSSGRIYVGGGRGLDRLDPVTGRVKHFTSADGLTGGALIAAYRDRHNVLWFGSTSGLVRLRPAPDRPVAPPPIIVNGLRVSGLAQHLSPLGQRELSLSDLSPSENQLQIDFAGLGFTSGEILRYQYRLVPGDEKWSSPSEQRTVNYAKLGPGRYQFSVRALTSDGDVSSRPATIAFRILPPIWQQPWFVALITVAIGLVVVSVHRYRVARLLQVANMRTRIAADLHDDIGANLTRIALLSEAARHRTRENQDPLSSIARIARESVGSMSDIVWAINPARDSLTDLTRRMRQHAEEVFTLGGVQMEFNAPGAIDTVHLGVDVRRDLLLLFKEAINNSARHSRCTHVAIDLSTTGSRLRMAIVDDGVGFDTLRPDEGQGLLSIRRRVDRLNGRLELTSSPGQGTSVIVVIPV
jgi:ligand-binding sensor domain-containing protein/two-component sensor histidine kinase